MAVTLHWVGVKANGALELRVALGAFRYLPGSHTGDNIAEVFVKVLTELGILNKVNHRIAENDHGTDIDRLVVLLWTAQQITQRQWNLLRSFSKLLTFHLAPSNNDSGTYQVKKIVIFYAN
jgi:hypothetical protein